MSQVFLLGVLVHFIMLLATEFLFVILGERDGFVVAKLGRSCLREEFLNVFLSVESCFAFLFTDSGLADAF